MLLDGLKDKVLSTEAEGPFGEQLVRLVQEMCTQFEMQTFRIL